jgi:CheY-like chemotaxis protein
MTTPAPTLSTPVPAKRQLRIIYAEDMRQLRDLMTLVLSRDGHTLECVDDGLQALQKIAANPANYDLLITDHHMPNMNGLDLVTHLRALPFPGKIIVFSSELGAAVSDAYRKLKVDYLLPKPIFPVTLRAVLATI